MNILQEEVLDNQSQLECLVFSLGAITHIIG